MSDDEEKKKRKKSVCREERKTIFNENENFPTYTTEQHARIFLVNEDNDDDENERRAKRFQGFVKAKEMLECFSFSSYIM
jgi:hypothetical protein